MLKNKTVLCTIQDSKGIRTDIKDIRHIWFDGVDFHIENGEKINVIIRDDSLNHINISIPLSKKNKT